MAHIEEKQTAYLSQPRLLFGTEIYLRRFPNPHPLLFDTRGVDSQHM